MIAVLKHNTTDEQLKSLTEWLSIQGLGTHVSRGNFQTVVGLIGDTSNVDIELLESLEMVESVQRVSDPCKTAAVLNTADREYTVGIVGLGLIGGSMAGAYKAAGWTVLGADRDKTTLGYAKLADIITDELTDVNIAKCDLLMLALYPQATIKWLNENAEKISRSTTVIDLCGIKQSVCEVGFRKAEEHGFLFVGGHPMAGTQFSGIKYSRSNLFKGAPMVLVPNDLHNEELIKKVKDMLAPAGFGRFSVTTAKDHDRMIAFTSQLAHVVSNAYIKSPTAECHGGFSAGSYKDMTRVAWLNEEMWTQLFLENGEALNFELDTIINALTQYRDAISANDADRLKGLLRDGRIAKENIDGNGAERLKK